VRSRSHPSASASSSPLPDAGLSAWAAFLFLAVVTSIVGYVGWYWALAHGGIGRIAPLQFLLSISGFALAALVLDERLTLPLAVGAAAVVAGVSLARRA
jgi:drug/metabolite transporter (DMT)-like permease